MFYPYEVRWKRARIHYIFTPPLIKVKARQTLSFLQFRHRTSDLRPQTILDRELILQRQIIKNPTPTLTLPLKGREFYEAFSPHRGDFMVFSHFHGSFSNPSPFKGEGRRGMGYICRCSINIYRKIHASFFRKG